MFQVHVASYLWDLEDEGIESVLDRIGGELGVSNLTVVAASGPVCHIRRHRDVRPRVFRTRGGLFFQPDDARFARTRCKPIVSGWLKARNPLVKVAEECARRDISLRVAIDARRTGRLVARYPSVAVKTVFGDSSAQCVCFGNPDAAEWLRGVVADVGALAGIELQGVDRVSETDVLDTTDPRVEPPGGVRGLFSVCFCESCMQSALSDGIDVDAAERSAQATLTRWIDGGDVVAESLHALVEDDLPLRAYTEHARSRHVAMLDRLGKSFPGALAIQCRRENVDESLVAALPAVCDELIVDAPNGSQSTDQWSRWLAIRESPCDVRIQARVRAWDPRGTDKTALVRSLRELVDLGLNGATIWHYGAMGEAEWTSAKQAVRFARRCAV
jgi:hypothetical protein